VDGVAGLGTSNASGRLPSSVTISPAGSLFVTETYYSLIREVTNITFTPVNLAATYPTVVTELASAITGTNATLNGTINAGGETTYYYFEWGPTTNYGYYAMATNELTSGLTNVQPVSMIISNTLAISNYWPNTNYHFQLVATNSLGIGYGGDVQFSVPPVPAIVTTLPATGITNNSVILNASVFPENAPTSVYFAWGVVSTLYGNNTADRFDDRSDQYRIGFHCSEQFAGGHYLLL
jgi:hypothetical protein